MDDLRREFWSDRPVVVTGASGLVGSWLVRRLLQAGAEVVCLPARLGFRRANSCAPAVWVKFGWCRATSATRRCLERALGEYEIHTVMHLAAQTIVGIANRNPLSNVRIEHRRHLETTRGVSPQSPGPASHRRVIG